MDILLITIGLTVFAVGLIYAFVEYGILKAISAYYYAFPSNRNFIFGIWCMLYSMPIGYATTSIFLKIATGCIIGVGMAAAYKGDWLIGKVHNIFALSAAIAGFLGICIDMHYPYDGVIFGLMAICLHYMGDKYKGVLLAETFTFGVIVIELLRYTIIG